tara:strand:- start:629 stop:1273 length:645 start_codon:yes stop_codon:yes gene_type:complete
MAKYLIRDNVVDPETFVSLQGYLMSPLPEWHLDCIVLPERTSSDWNPSDNNLQGSFGIYDDIFQHIYYPDVYGCDGRNFKCRLDIMTQCLNQVIKHLNPLAIIRVKANVNFRTEKIIESPYHVDRTGDEKGNCDDMFNAIFYINTCDGYTRFKDENNELGEKIMSQENRLAIFNNKYYHAGTSTTDQFARYVININYVPKKNCPLHKTLDGYRN